MRYLAVAVLAALAAVAALLGNPRAPQPGDAPGADPAPFSVCATEEASGRETRIGLLSAEPGIAVVTSLTGSEASVVSEWEVPEAGAVAVPASEAASVGRGGSLVEATGPVSLSAAIVTGADTLAVAACPGTFAPQVLIAGGASTEGERFDLYLMNPFAGDATAELTVRSESGPETSDRFESVAVPAGSTSVLPVSEIIPGRQSVTITVDAVEGRLFAMGHRARPGGTAAWSALAPAEDWFLPVPSSEGRRSLIVATSADVDVEFQIDTYTGAGLEEGAFTDTVPSRGEVRVDLDGISEGPMAVRVISAGPVVPFVEVVSEQGLAISEAPGGPATTWLLPGSGAGTGEGQAAALVLNSGIDPATVEIRPLRGGSAATEVAVDPDSVASVSLPGALGYLIESDTPVVVTWSGPSALAVGPGFADG